MSNPNLPPEPEKPRLEGREAAIAALGAIGFGVEQGPNRRVPEKLPAAAEQQPEGVIEALASRSGPIVEALKIRDAFDRKREGKH